MPDHFDLIVLGGGPGGYTAALHAAAMQKSVLLIEKDALGGVCLNKGCIPTKALLRSAALYRTLQNEGAALGVTAQPQYSLAAMHRHATDVRDQLRAGVAGLLSRAKVTVLKGLGTVADPHTVTVDGQSYTADHILLAMGSSPAKPPIEGLALPGVVTSDQLLTGEGVDCQRLVIIGGGVIGVEFAQVYADLGRQVTVIEALPRLLNNMDREFGQSLQMTLKKRGCQIFTNAGVQRLEAVSGGINCVFSQNGAENAVQGDCVLVCTGRRPNTLEALSPEVAEVLGLQKGYVPVDAQNQTAVPGLYAIGDIVWGGVQLAHAAEAEAVNAAEAMFGGQPYKTLSAIPACVFTDPEIASVGLTADQAKERGVAVITQKNLTSANGKAIVEGAERGFAKLVFSQETGKLLGAQLMCPHAGEMIGTLTACLNAGLTKDQLRSTVYPHPTVSEILGS